MSSAANSRGAFAPRDLNFANVSASRTLRKRSPPSPEMLRDVPQVLSKRRRDDRDEDETGDFDEIERPTARVRGDDGTARPVFKMLAPTTWYSAAKARAAISARKCQKAAGRKARNMCQSVQHGVRTWTAGLIIKAFNYVAPDNVQATISASAPPKDEGPSSAASSGTTSTSDTAYSSSDEMRHAVPAKKKAVTKAPGEKARAFRQKKREAELAEQTEFQRAKKAEKKAEKAEKARINKEKRAQKTADQAQRRAAASDTSSWTSSFGPNEAIFDRVERAPREPAMFSAGLPTPPSSRASPTTSASDSLSEEENKTMDLLRVEPRKDDPEILKANENLFAAWERVKITGITECNKAGTNKRVQVFVQSSPVAAASNQEIAAP
ncbi:hypothetical protein BDV95DRAFT_608096 [Massariosphaeria phaeospora]|uniref:Uncharacterized protein n=1 Tax=Massariosphaeria phaeospora TaxID=100035 RepID=A0A7C8I7G1_9PLEO|nr:hypothetical protein BDV95DRAFT_608096 [Massariosphaeria phaeospora]